MEAWKESLDDPPAGGRGEQGPEGPADLKSEVPKPNLGAIPDSASPSPTTPSCQGLWILPPRYPENPPSTTTNTHCQGHSPATVISDLDPCSQGLVSIRITGRT